MPQTVDALSFRDNKIEIGADPIAGPWVDVSGSTNSLEVSGGDWQIGTLFTFLGMTAILTSGKRDPLDIACNMAYTETAGEAFETARPFYENGTPCYIRWSPKGGLSTQARYQTGTYSRVKSFKWPGGVAEGGAPVLALLTVAAATVARSVIV
jgi:hypothetical protein